MKQTIFLGHTVNNEVVFANIDNSRGYFSVSFDASYPQMIGEEQIKEQVESMIDSMDDSHKLHLLEQYDVAPSELADSMMMDSYDFINDFFDNSLYTEEFRIDGQEDSIYFLASGCGQHDTRNEMAWKVNTELYDFIHKLWDEYHLKDIPVDLYEKLEDAIVHQNNTMDEYRVIQKWLERTYNN